MRHATSCLCLTVVFATNVNLPLTEAQKRAIVDYVRNGKALVGVHCGGGWPVAEEFYRFGTV